MGYNSNIVENSKNCTCQSAIILVLKTCLMHNWNQSVVLIDQYSQWKSETVGHVRTTDIVFDINHLIITQFLSAKIQINVKLHYVN